MEARDGTPTPTGVLVAEASCNTVEPWLGPALAAANERIAVLESTVTSERETQAKLRETHKSKSQQQNRKMRGSETLFRSNLQFLSLQTTPLSLRPPFGASH